jgi:hypothetical protein
MATRQNQEGKCKEKWNYSFMSNPFFTELHKPSPGKLGEGNNKLIILIQVYALLLR